MRLPKLLITAALLCAATAQAQQKKPNIVLIMADDLGIGDLGSYGQKIIQTPNLDRLGQQGLRFDNFYSGTSVCAPSRSALMTGQHTGHTHIRGNKEIEPEGQEPLADSVRTIAMNLQEAGYVTAAFGKWGLGMVGSTGSPNRKGFDEFYGYICQRQSHRYYPTHLWHNAERIILQGNDLSHKVHYAPSLIQEKTLQFIEDNKDKPFFLFVPTVLPHAELAGPEDSFFKRYEQSFIEKAHQGNDYGPKATVSGYASVDKPRATYAAMVSRLDQYVGEILAKLDEHGLTENSIIIFTSDNGAHREGGADPEYFNSTMGLRGFKRELYEGGIRTPFIVSWPAQIKASTTTTHTAAFWDIMPTLQELAGSKPKGYTDGISFLPTLIHKGKQKKHEYLYWEFHEDGGRQAVRHNNWKLIKQKVKNPALTSIELYDLSKDPAEQTNLAQQEPAITKKLLKYIAEAHTENSIFPLLN